MRPNTPTFRQTIKLALLLFVLSSGVGYAQDGIIQPSPTHLVDSIKESKVKAVYLYSFGRFTKWPHNQPNAATDFVIGVVGASGVEANLEQIATKRTIHDKQIRIARFHSIQDEGISSCQIVFLTRTVSSIDTASLTDQLRDTSVLIVTESPNRPNGSIVNFIIEGEGVHFEINSGEAQRKKLTMDARLLRQGRKMLPNSHP